MYVIYIYCILYMYVIYVYCILCMYVLYVLYIIYVCYIYIYCILYMYVIYIYILYIIYVCYIYIYILYIIYVCYIYILYIIYVYYICILYIMRIECRLRNTVHSNIIQPSRIHSQRVRQLAPLAQDYCRNRNKELQCRSRYPCDVTTETPISESSTRT